MENKYMNLSDLIHNDESANAYFTALPGHVQENIRDLNDRIKSFENLQDQAERAQEDQRSDI